MNSTLHTCIDIVSWGDAIQVINIWFQRHQEHHCSLARDGGDLQASRADLHNLVVVLLDAYVGGRGVDWGHIRCFQVGERIIKTVTNIFASVHLFRDFKGLNFRTC